MMDLYLPPLDRLDEIAVNYESQQTMLSDADWKKISTEEIAYFFVSWLILAVLRKTKNYESLKNVVVYSRQDYDYANLALMGIHSDEPIGCSVDVPHRFVTPKENIQIAIRSNQLLQKAIATIV